MDRGYAYSTGLTEKSCVSWLQGNGWLGCHSIIFLPVYCFYSREQRAKYPCLHGYLATAARIKYPRTLVRCALQRCKFDTSLLAAGSLIHCKGYVKGWQDEKRIFYIDLTQEVIVHFRCEYWCKKRSYKPA